MNVFRRHERVIREVKANITMHTILAIHRHEDTNAHDRRVEFNRYKFSWAKNGRADGWTIRGLYDLTLKA
jgi:hypothetical protein